MKRLFRQLASFGLLALATAPLPARGDTKLQLVTGDKEFPQVQQALTLSTPEILPFQWSTDVAGVAGGNWQVTTKNAANVDTVVVQGKATPGPAAGVWGAFTIAQNAFLAPAPPAVPKAYSITIRPYDTKGNPVGTLSSAVVVTQAPAGPPIKITIVTPTYPDVVFQGYVGPPTPNGTGNLRVKVVNNGATATASVALSVTDGNFLVKSDPVSIPSLPPKSPGIYYDLKLVVQLPPPPSALYDPDKLRQQWQQSYHDKGVNLVALLDYRAQDFRKIAMYQGKTDSCQDGVKDGDEMDVDCGGSCGTCFGHAVAAEDWRKVYGFQFTNTTAFKNLGGDYDLGDLQGLYGDSSIYIYTPIPVPSPLATNYLVIADAAIRNGRCFGFSLAALRFFHRDEGLLFYPSVVSNAPDAAVGLSYDTWHLKGTELSLDPGAQNVSPGLVRLIKRQHALQLSAESISHYLDARIHNSLDYLRDNLNGNLPAILSLSQGGSGHAVVAHHVDPQPDGSFLIRCYDPNVPWNPPVENAPGAQNAFTNCTVHVGPGNTYWYDDKSGGVAKSGTASTDLTVFPYSLYKNPSMPSLEGIANATLFGGVAGGATIKQVTDASGRPLFLPNGAVNYDPRTRILAHPYYPLDSVGGPVRYIVMDAKGSYTHTIAPTGAYQVNFVGPSYSVQLDRVSGTAGDADQVTIDPTGALGLSTTAAQKVVHGNLSARAADKSTRVATLGVTLSNKAPVRLEFDPARETLVYRHAGASANLSLGLWTSTNAKATFSGKPIAVGNGDVLTIKPNWSKLDSTPGSVHVMKGGGAVSDLTLQ